MKSSGLWACQAGGEKAQERLTSINTKPHQYQRWGCKQDGARVFTEVHSWTARDNGHQLDKRKQINEYDN